MLFFVCSLFVFVTCYTHLLHTCYVLEVSVTHVIRIYATIINNPPPIIYLPYFVTHTKYTHYNPLYMAQCHNQLLLQWCNKYRMFKTVSTKFFYLVYLQDVPLQFFVWLIIIANWCGSIEISNTRNRTCKPVLQCIVVLVEPYVIHKFLSLMVFSFSLWKNLEL